EFKRQVVEEYLGGETLHGLAKRHEISRNLIHIWVEKYEAGGFDVCGDCTEARIAELALAGAKPLLMVTDPPYGVDYNPRWRLDAGVNKPHQVRAEGRVSNDERADWREAWALFPGDVAYVWHGGLHSSVVEASLATCGFEMRAQIIWAKQTIVIGRGHY